MHTSSMCIIGVELSSRICSEEIAIHCSCSAIIVVMTLCINVRVARMNMQGCMQQQLCELVLIKLNRRRWLGLAEVFLCRCLHVQITMSLY